jgi:hypothetical protein
VILLLVALLAWWPGGERAFTGMDYEYRIPVVNTIGYLGNLRPAIRDWNACGSVRLYLAPDVPPKSPGSITIVNETWGDLPPPWGGWMGEYGLISLGARWTRSVRVIEHELGHAMGFAHTRKSSIMNIAPDVQPIDCEGLRNYY